MTQLYSVSKCHRNPVYSDYNANVKQRMEKDKKILRISYSGLCMSQKLSMKQNFGQRVVDCIAKSA